MYQDIVSGNPLTSYNERPVGKLTQSTSLVVPLVPRASLANRGRRRSLAEIDGLLGREAEERPERLHNATQLIIGDLVGLVGRPLAQLCEDAHLMIWLGLQ